MSEFLQLYGKFVFVYECCVVSWAEESLFSSNLLKDLQPPRIKSHWSLGCMYIVNKG
jgi:hypothetical protein